jgi:anti-sigma factor RsiW
MSCPNEIELQCYFDHELNAWHSRRVRRHLDGCEACRKKVAQYGWVTDTLQKTLGRASNLPDEVLLSSCVRPRLVRMAIAAAFMVVIGFWGWRFSVWKDQSAIAPQDEELTEQYLSLHMDEVNGGKNG